MKYLLSILFAVTLMATPEFAEAKRFGGGFSLGKSYSMPKKVAPAPTKSVASNTTKNSGATKPGATTKPALGGMMGGLLAGGLLGALFFGGAFDGIQLMDILLIGLVLFFVFNMFGSRRPSPAYAGVYGQAEQQEPFAQRQSESVMSSGNWGGLSEELGSQSIETPEWFDRTAFLEGAEQHFRNLQKAWDILNWEEIASYTSPELLNALKSNRAVLPENQETEVVSVMVDLANYQEDGDQAVVSLMFHGWIRENGAVDTIEFSEVWHLSRDKENIGGEWFIVGIEQI